MFMKMSCDGWTKLWSYFSIPLFTAGISFAAMLTGNAQEGAAIATAGYGVSTLYGALTYALYRKRGSTKNSVRNCAVQYNEKIENYDEAEINPDQPFTNKDDKPAEDSQSRQNRGDRRVGMDYYGLGGGFQD